MRYMTWKICMVRIVKPNPKNAPLAIAVRSAILRYDENECKASFDSFELTLDDNSEYANWCNEWRMKLSGKLDLGADASNEYGRFVSLTDEAGKIEVECFYHEPPRFFKKDGTDITPV